MDLIQLIITLAIVGFALWLITTYVPMAAPIKNIIMVIVAIAALLWLLSWAGLGHISLPAHPAR